MNLLAVLGSQGIIVKCTAVILFPCGGFGIAFVANGKRQLPRKNYQIDENSAK